LTSITRPKVIPSSIKHRRRTISRRQKEKSSRIEHLRARGPWCLSSTAGAIDTRGSLVLHGHTCQESRLLTAGLSIWLLDGAPDHQQVQAYQRQFLLCVVSIPTFSSHMFGGPNSSGTSLLLDACDSLPLWQPSITPRQEAHRQVEQRVLLHSRHQTIYVLPHSKPTLFSWLGVDSLTTSSASSSAGQASSRSFRWNTML
jgi:hypothetical protein